MTRLRSGSKLDCHNQTDARCIDTAADADPLDEAATVDGDAPVGHPGGLS